MAIDHKGNKVLQRVRCFEFFARVAQPRLVQAKRHFDVRYDEIQTAVKAFRAEGYRNEWTHKIRSFTARVDSADLSIAAWTPSVSRS